MIRKDVMRLAEALQDRTGIDADCVYAWLMHIGREKGTNPKNLEYVSAAGIIFLKGERDSCFLQRLYHAPHRIGTDGADYESMILARQEAMTD